MEPLKAIELPIKKIFSSDYAFRIPSYQRPYSWTTEQVHELFNDLMDALDDYPLNARMEDIRPYFLGAIVLIKNPLQADSDVVDGQQRLTTLTLLLAILRDCADNVATANAVQNLIYQKGDPIIGDPDRFRLTLRPRDSDFFRVRVQEPGGIQALDSDPGDLTDSQRNIRENGIELRSRVADLDPAWRNRLAAFIIQRCFLVVVSANDRDAAYRIFSVMNDRGLDLSATDILKADIIGQLQGDPAREKKVTDVWEDLEDDLGRTHFEELFGHIRMMFVKQKAKQTLIEEFRKGVLPHANGQQFVTDVLVPYAKSFEQVLDSDVAAPQHRERINRVLRTLNRLDNSDWMPPAIKYIADHRGDGPAILQFLSALERLAYSLFLRREYPTERIARFGAVLQLMPDTAQLFGGGSKLDLTETEKTETLQQLDGPIYESRRLRLPILLRLDELLTAGGASYDFSVISVEHVLPQSPSPDSEWLKLFASVELRELWVHRIGNLALLPFRKNAQASNFDFDRKKNEYFAKGGATNFSLTTEIVHATAWTPDAVKERQARLVGLLRAAWRLNKDDRLLPP